jgi:translation initiation factor IF-3
VPEVRLVGAAGEQVGIVGIEDALRMAMEADLDLVEVAPEAKPPVCKIMDYGKFKYEAAVKAREARKNQVNTVIKEMKLRPKIDLHDYVTKKGHIERFLLQGDKVKITIMFRGREQSRPELGYKLLQRLASDIGEAAVIESSPLQDGRNMTMVLAPARKGSGAKAAKPAPVVTTETVTAPAVAPETVTAPVVTPETVTAPVVTPETVTAPAVAPETVTAPVVTPETVTAPVVTAPVVTVETVAEPKAAAKKVAVKKAAAEKPAAPKPAAKKVAVKKAAAEKPVAKKAAAKKTSKDKK